MMPKLTSRPLTKAEFENYEKDLLIWYANELIKAGICTAENAATTAKSDVIRLCPKGLESENCYFQYLINNENKEIGFLWYSIRKINGFDENPLIFICDIKVFDNYRGQGYGRAMMEYVEEQTKGHNLDKILLNVFDENEVAKKLYLSLGYEVLQEGIGSAAMLKKLN